MLIVRNLHSTARTHYLACRSCLCAGLHHLHHTLHPQTRPIRGLVHCGRALYDHCPGNRMVHLLETGTEEILPAGRSDTRGKESEGKGSRSH